MIRIDGNSKVYLGNSEIATIKKGNTVIWQKSAPAEIDYFYVENLYNGTNTLQLKTQAIGPPSSGYSNTVQYSKDKENWTTLTLTAGSQQTISMAKGVKVYFRNNNGKWNYYDNQAWRTSFYCILNYKVGGNVNSLLDYTNIDNVQLSTGCFQGLFINFNSGGVNSTLKDASALVLPATTLAKNCYAQMFYYCDKLVTGPQSLPATTLAEQCYTNMFQNCSALTTAPQTLPATTLAKTCYFGMYQYCSSLTTAPVLPAKTLTNSCYQQMFYMDSRLNSVTVYADNISASSSHQSWLGGVAASGTFTNLGSASWPTNSGNGIPSGWTEVKPDYLHIDNTYAGTNTVTLTTTVSGEPVEGTYSPSVQYKVNNGSWTTLVFDTSNPATITVPQDGKVYFRNSTGQFNSNNYYTTITASQSHTVGGNAHTLLDYLDLNPTSAPAGCLELLFHNDTTLTSADGMTLPATSVGVKSYYSMFHGCTALTHAPRTLPATTLASSCYDSMFQGCSALVFTPEALPATTLAPYCYQEMFYGCQSITMAPGLPASTLADYCYQNIYRGCSSLNMINISADDISATGCLTNWVNGVAATGTFYNTGSATYTTGNDGKPSGWSDGEYFFIRNVSGDETTLSLNVNTYNAPPQGSYSTTLEYSTDGSTWTTVTLDPEQVIEIQIADDSKVWFRNGNGKFNHHDIFYNDFYTTFYMPVNFETGGNVNSLLDYRNMTTVPLTDGCFFRLFYELYEVETASIVGFKLPSMRMAPFCYQEMFGNCPCFTQAPALPATTLANNCYQYMFMGTQIVIAPALPATTLADNCYNGMFTNCWLLTSAPALPATTLKPYCYINMFSSCENLQTAPALPATTLAEGCYQYMFTYSGITSITLPATTPATSCYSRMFTHCQSLSSITLNLTSISDNTTLSWLNERAPSMTGTFYNNGMADLPFDSESGIPTGWTEVTPAITSVTPTTGTQANPLTAKSYETIIRRTWTLTCNMTGGGTKTRTITKDITLTENTTGSTRTLTQTFTYQGCSYTIYIQQTYGDTAPAQSLTVTPDYAGDADFTLDDGWYVADNSQSEVYAMAQIECEGYGVLELQVVNDGFGEINYMVVSQPNQTLEEDVWTNDDYTGTPTVFHNFKEEDSATPVTLQIPLYYEQATVEVKAIIRWNEEGNNVFKFKVLN